MANQSRIDALEQENATLRAELAALSARLDRVEAAVPKPKPAPPNVWIERPATITAPPPAPPMNMPSDAELVELLRRVRERYPTFRPRYIASEDQEARYFAAFKGAVRWLASVGRTKEPNTRYAYEALVDKCEHHLRLVSASVPMSYGPLMAAAIAVGDCVFEDPGGGVFPWCSIGVSPDTQRTYDGCYRQILAGARDFLKPIVKPQPPQFGASVYHGETSVIHNMRARGMLDY